MQTNKLTASALLICTCVIWGIQPMFAKFVVREMSPIPMVSIRYTIVALTLFAMLAWRGEKLLPPRRTWPALFTMGILGVCINNVTQFTGLQYSTVTNFTIIATLTPIVTALLSFVLIHERLHRLQWLGICSSLCGALYLISNGSLAAILTLSFNIGDVLFFTSQVAWALYSIIVVRIIDDVSPFAIVAWSGSVRFAYHGSWCCLSWPFRTALAAFTAGSWLISVRHFCRRADCHDLLEQRHRHRRTQSGSRIYEYHAAGRHHLRGAVS